MKKNEIIKHYKDFFDLHAKGIALTEDDHLNLDWAEDLVKNCTIPDVVQQRKLLLAFSSYVNKHELKEADDQITDYSIKEFLKSQ